MGSELKTRAISALVLATIAIFGTFFGGKIFVSMVSVAGLLIYFEWSRLTGMNEGQPASNFVGWAALLSTFISLFFGLTVIMFVCMLVGLVISMLLSQIKYRNIWPAAGFVYAALPVVALAEIRGTGFFGLVAILYIFAIVWATDIFAYFFGRRLKGPKLAPKISPGKTWSGALSGLLFGIITGVLIIWSVSIDVTWWAIICSSVISIFSQIGDLFESQIKRRFDAKDSSNLIPGHGGFMDRLDGVIFGVIIAFALAQISQYITESSAESELAVYLLGL